VGALPPSSGLPEGFRWIRAGSWRIALRSDLADDLVDLGIEDPGALSQTGDKTYEGRGKPVRVELPDGSRAVLRRFRHGGLLRAFTGKYFVGPSRPMRELRAIETARRAGVRVPDVLAALQRKSLLVCHEGYLLTREVPGARDLVEILTAGEPADALLADAGRETRKLHESGVWHADLHVKNVLADGGRAWLLDFDRARVYSEVSPSRRRENLLRFYRSLEKLARRGVRLGRCERLRFFRGYHAGRLERPERDVLARSCRRSLRWHRAAWAIFGPRSRDGG